MFHTTSACLLLRQQLKRQQNINGAYQGLGGGKGRVDQSHAHSFSRLSAPTDEAAWLVAPSPWPRVPFMSLLGQRQYHLWEECPVAIAFRDNAVHLQYPSPLPEPSPLTPALFSPRIVFPPRGCSTNDPQKPQKQVRHFILHYLLAGQSLGCFPETKWRATECCIDVCNIDFPPVCYWGGGVVFLLRA